jgi:methyltransferase of ATP-grasp peptide maturase system
MHAPSDDLISGKMTQLAGQLADQGKITTPEWREVFERTPRHVFLPRFYVREDRPGSPTVWREMSTDDGPAWLDAVYTNVTHVTSLDPNTQRPADGGGWHGNPTSSSTLPSVMGTMLEQLDVHDGMRVLEIGTGTGYTCGLLCQRLGSAHVVSIDINPDVATQARRRLNTAGYHPAVHAADGYDGYPPKAPYDRLIATCSVPRIPAAWIDQVKPGGVILADLRGPIGDALARVIVTPDGGAEGRFPRDGAYFMPMRRHPAHYPRQTPFVLAPADETRTTSLAPASLYDFTFAFIAQPHLPDVSTFHEICIDGQPHMELQAADGSWARVRLEAEQHGAWQVSQGGPCRLWTLAENAHTFWVERGRPGWSRFGLSVSAADDRQRVWFDHSGSDQWELATA